MFTPRTGYSGTHRKRIVSKGSSEFKHPTFPIKYKTMDVVVYYYCTNYQLSHSSSWIRVRSEGGNRKNCSNTIHSWEAWKQEDQKESSPTDHTSKH